ncbi:hypothetical protein SUDANB176_00355 [Streptomyces sp. enrichment culture]
MGEGRKRPLGRVCPVLFVDALDVRPGDGQSANRHVHVVRAVTVDGIRDFLGIRAGDGGGGAAHRPHVFAKPKNRGLDDVLVLVRDGLKGLSEAVKTI